MNNKQTPSSLFRKAADDYSKLPSPTFIDNPLPSSFNFTKPSANITTSKPTPSAKAVDRPFGHIFVSNGDETPLLIDIRNAYYDKTEQLYIIPLDNVEGDLTKLSASSSPLIQPNSDLPASDRSIDIPLNFLNYPTPDGTAKQCTVCVTAPIDANQMYLVTTPKPTWEKRWFSDETAPC